MSKSCVTFFVWKVSNLGLISLLFFLWIVSNPEVVFFLRKVSNPEVVFFLRKVSNPGHGTKIARGLDWVHSLVSATVHWVYLQIFLSKVPQEFILVTAPKLQEDWIGYKDIGYYFIKSMSLLKPGATRCHGTRIARGVPLPIYINLDLYSGFWCTSHCVVFKHSVPPLTDQALRKVLLTS